MENVQKNHVKKKGSWNWADLKYVSIGIIIITIIISLFDYHPDLSFWMIEILRNLVISACISLTIFVLTSAIGRATPPATIGIPYSKE